MLKLFTSVLKTLDIALEGRVTNMGRSLSETEACLRLNMIFMNLNFHIMLPLYYAGQQRRKTAYFLLRSVFSV